MAKQPIATDNKAEVMSDTDLAEIIAPFLDRMEKRDIESRKESAQVRKEIGQNSKDIAKLTGLFENLFKDKESLFGFHNENVNERLKSGKEQWKTVLYGLTVAAAIMGCILAPLVANIAANKAVVTMLSATQSDIKTSQAVMGIKQYYSDVINGIERDHQNQISGAWVDDGGRVAHPARRVLYVPQEP